MFLFWIILAVSIVLVIVKIAENNALSAHRQSANDNSEISRQTAGSRSNALMWIILAALIGLLILGAVGLTPFGRIGMMGSFGGGRCHF